MKSSFPLLAVLIFFSLLMHLAILILVKPCAGEENRPEPPMPVGLTYIENEQMPDQEAARGEKPAQPEVQEEEALQETLQGEREATTREPSEDKKTAPEAKPAARIEKEEKKTTREIHDLREAAPAERAGAENGPVSETPEQDGEASVRTEGEPPGPEQTGAQKVDLDDFLERVRQRKVYPQAARRRGYEGRVLVLLHLDREGNLVNISVSESSGYRMLDKAALCIVEGALPFRHGAGAPLVLEIPVQYTLR